MFSKLYETGKRILKENYKGILFFIFLGVIMTYPVPYYIFTSGGITDLSERFTVEGGYSQKGSYNLSYVTEIEGNVVTYLASFLIPSWDAVEVSNYQASESESLEDLAVRDRLSLAQANQTALQIAYQKAGKTFQIHRTNLYVAYIDEKLESTTKIKIGDLLTKVEGKEIAGFADFEQAIAEKKVGESLTVELLRGENTVLTEVKVREEEGRKLVGMVIYALFDYDVEPKIEFHFKAHESGSSAGMMTSLAIYDSLIEEDLTNGLVIAGTGTIESDGSVGEIGGVHYKLKGAVSAHADVFFVPYGDNYQDAIQLKNEKNYDIEVIPVNTIDDAIHYLENKKIEKKN